MSEIEQYGRECLILPCSPRKVAFDKPMPAIEVFDGVLMRVVRKREPGIDMFILSAKYGLIPARHPIELYEVSTAEVVNRDWVIENVVKRWITLTEGEVDRYDTIWHVTRGATFKAIGILKRFGNLRHVIPDDYAGNRNHISAMLSCLKDFCIARPTYDDIDVDAMVAAYKERLIEQIKPGRT